MTPTTKAQHRLAGFIGSRGVQVSSIPDEAGLIAVTSEMFELPATEDIEAMVEAVAALTRAERGRRASAYVQRTIGSGGSGLQRRRAPSPIRPDWDAHTLLRKVVTAVINHGHAADLYEYPDVLAYFGSRTPACADALACGGGSFSARSVMPHSPAL
jgi:hypothetical protein